MWVGKDWHLSIRQGPGKHKERWSPHVGSGLVLELGSQRSKFGPQFKVQWERGWGKQPPHARTTARWYRHRTPRKLPVVCRAGTRGYWGQDGQREGHTGTSP